MKESQTAHYSESVSLSAKWFWSQHAFQAKGSLFHLESNLNSPQIRHISSSVDALSLIINITVSGQYHSVTTSLDWK